MTILFASGEDSGFTGSVNNQTSFGRWRSAFARIAVFATSNNTAVDPVPNRLIGPTFTPAAGGVTWIHGQFYEQGSSSTLNVQSIIVRSPDGVSRIVVRQTSVFGILKVSTRNSLGTITDLATAVTGFPSSQVTQFDMRIDYSATGGVRLWINGAIVLDYSGDPRTDSATQLNQVELAGFAGNNTYWSEVIVADQDTRGMNLFTLPPIAPGNTQAWLPNNVNNINENVGVDTTFVAATANNSLSGWTVSPLVTPLPPGTWSVAAVIQEARASVGVLGPQHFDWVTRTGGADHLAGSPEAPLLVLGNFNNVWSVNPGTGSAWQVSDITDPGFNLGIISQV